MSLRTKSREKRVDEDECECLLRVRAEMTWVDSVTGEPRALSRDVILRPGDGLEVRDEADFLLTLQIDRA